ncbi:aminopeptidase P family protein [Lactobacillus sp. DCY120]|uniref:Aminopeptidase P family protein n=1 Tax=Bombilactobacillus apium TaxID=2675299 RepID=A0A850R435_9LACO|nr:aminopeptidase P family protein [Bombilactobacillus apium]NVY95597.1 aminopeptidase P family protein [Bombilactobacillus apium]
MEAIAKIQAYLQEYDQQAILISHEANCTYFLDDSDFEGFLIITLDQQYIYTDGRFITSLQELEDTWTLIDRKNQALPNWLQKHQLTQILIEPDFLTARTYQALQEQNLKLTDSHYLVEKIRMQKTASEVAKVQQAAQIADQVFEHILPFIKPGIRETDLAAEMEFWGKKLGASGVSFPTIVASGTRSAMPHGSATSKKIAAHELVVLDFGFIYEGYDSDITRTVAVGSVSPQLAEIYQIVRNCQMKVAAQLHLGQSLAEIDILAHQLVDQAGYGLEFMHGTGHGVGRECHEYPTINAQTSELLKPNFTFTLEPGIYLPDLGGVRIEDDLYLDEQGQVNWLTQSSKEFQIL